MDALQVPEARTHRHHAGCRHHHPTGFNDAYSGNDPALFAL